MPLAWKPAKERTARALEQPRIVAGLVVFAAHLALIFLLTRSARHPAEEAVEVVLITLPITPDEQINEPPPRPQPPSRSTRGRTRKDTPLTPPPSTISNTPVAVEPITPPPDSAPIPQIDWHAELTTSARAAEERARIERERRTLSGLAQEPMKLPAPRRACPFEQCEPGWDAPPSIFPHSKAGRVEKTGQGEVIRWLSDSCYQILITEDIMHRAMTKCQRALGKNQARGDLFDHMRDVPPPVERAVDVP